MNKGLIAMISLILIAGAAVIFWNRQPSDDMMTPTVNTAMHGTSAGAAATPADQIIVPETFSSAALIGQKTFNANCAKCHGINGAGTMQGPPLIHQIYEPGHHGDNAFQQAAKNGVQAHHWRFGNMKPIAGLNPDKIQGIATYIREIQRANGIN